MRPFAVFSALLLVACRLIGDSGPAGSTKVSVPPAAVAGELAVLFDMSVTTVGFKPHRETSSYYFFRGSNWVATLSTNGVNGVRWRRSEDGQISMEQFFPTEKHIVELTPGDLKALNQRPAWDHLRSIINPALLNALLKPTDTTNEFDGRKARRFEGAAGGTSWELDWSGPDLIPLRLQQVRADRILTLTARGIHPLRSAPWTLPDMEGFRRTDFADLGDMPNDPAVRRLTKLGLAVHNHCLH